MGMDVAFWRYRQAGGHNHLKTYISLLEREGSDVVAALPVSEIKRALSDDLGVEWRGSDEAGWEGEKHGFEISLDTRRLTLSCYGDFADDLGRFAKTMERFKCPAFVPATGERHGNEFEG